MSTEWPSSDVLLRVEQLINACIGPLDQHVRPTPLAGALQIATFQILKTHLEAPQQEEDLTSMLLGAYVSATTWVLEILESGESAGLTWGHHNKHGSSDKSEGSTGADFSLLIKFGDEFARAAVFQAKRSDSDDTVGIHRIAPYRAQTRKQPERLPEPQMLRLVSHGLKISASTDESDLDWLHYCAYGPTSFFCIPLTQATQTLVNYRLTKTTADAALLQFQTDNSEDPSLHGKLKAEGERLYKNHRNDAMRRDEHTRELLHLLASGASSEPESEYDVPGWLTLRTASAIGGFVESFSNDVKIVELNGSSAPGPTADATIINQLNDALKSYKSPASSVRSASPKPRNRG
ncbi:hypothetical protein [Xanthomonas hortorum]|uniref:hypothetical protein n=1 Tax=Xanthomonas hortorum TaxID=56454 RepID=UPI0032E8B8B5